MSKREQTNSTTVDRARSVRKRRAARDPQGERRGVILLVILAMLALFLLVTMSFMVIAIQGKNVAVAVAEREQQGDSFEQLLTEACNQTVRGTNNRNSVIGPHSLLEDKHGSDGVIFEVPSSFWIDNGDLTGGTPISPSFGTSAMFLAVGGINMNNNRLHATSGYYTGRLLTMLDGDARGLSGRILEYRVANVAGSMTAYFYVEPLDGQTWNGAAWGPQTTKPGDRALISGRPFNGTGFGYGLRQQDFPGGGAVSSFDPTLANPTYLLDHNYNFGVGGIGSGTEFLAEIALLPNPAAFRDPFPLAPPYVAPRSYIEAATLGGADEDYDAVDFQNMLLALRRPGAPAYIAGVTIPANVPIPSLHRPALINYWYQRIASTTFVDDHAADVGAAGGYTPAELVNILERPFGADWDPHVVDPNGSQVLALDYKDGINTADEFLLERILRLKRRFILRPLREDHPNFTGGNPAYSLPGGELFGPWDVDNDGDGVADSIWVDLGMPVRTNNEGQLVKPLFAIHCLDLDGRVNLNAHGSIDSFLVNGNPVVDGLRELNPATQYKAAYAPIGSTPGMLTVSGSPAVLPRGQGYGPAEVALERVMEYAGIQSLGTPQAINTPSDAFFVLAGRDTGAAFVDGRYGESYLLDPNTPHIPQAGRTTVWQQGGDNQWGVGGGTDDNFDGLPPGPDGDYRERGWTVGVDLLDPTTSPNFVNDDNLPLRPVARVPSTTNARGDYPWNQLSFNYEVPGLLSTEDLNGDGILGVDVRGWPVYARFGSYRERMDDPYEIDLTASGYDMESFGLAPPNLMGATGLAPVDRPFRVNELERLLRSDDADASTLPTRLLELAPNTYDPVINPDAAYYRGLVTSEGWDLPVPGAVPPWDAYADGASMIMSTNPERSIYRTAFDPNDRFDASTVTILDLLRSKLARGLNRNPSIKTQNQEINSILTNLVGNNVAPSAPGILRGRIAMAPEVVSGLRFNLNRMFGNGTDDHDPNFGVTANGVVDEPLEGGAGFEALWKGNTNLVSKFDANNDGQLDAWDMRARQEFCQQLYVLVMILLDDEWLAGDATETAEDRARRVAQWVVNVVDFRDSDSIMTPFEYDIYPFENDVPATFPVDETTWDVDGWVKWTPGPIPPTNAPQQWGADGVDDDSNGLVDDYGDAGAAATDDQMSPDDALPHRGLVWGCERPELVITETLAFHDHRMVDGPAGSGMTSGGDDDYDQAERPQGSLYIELHNPNGGDQQPAEFYRDNSDNPQNGVVLSKRAKFGAALASPVWRMAITDGAVPPVPPESPVGAPTVLRDVYFTSGLSLQGSDIPATPSGAFYRADAGLHDEVNRPIIVPPGGYAVIGPGGTANATDPIELGTNRQIHQMDPNSASPTDPRFRLLDSGGSPIGDQPNLNQIQNPVSVVINNPYRLSVSEPNGTTETYYPNIDPNDPNGPQDEPLDRPRATAGAEPGFDALGIEGTNGSTVDQQFRYVFLQRLANPLVPWDADTNPYLTVDTFPIDLTVFNSTEAAPDPSGWVTGGTTRLNTRQRDGGVPTDKNPWNWADDWTTLAAQGDLTNPLPDATLGFANRGWSDSGTPFPINSHVYTSADTMTDTPSVDPNGIGFPAYYGVPETIRPKPWLTWNNRPFSSHYELLLVPDRSAANLLRSHSVKDLPTPGNGLPYDPLPDPNDPNAPVRRSFDHLPNFFHTSASSGATGSTPDDETPHLYRLLEYVDVPSRFSGTEKMLSPGAFENDGDDRHSFHAPFNYVSTYREPGKININTISEDPNHGAELIWQAIRGDYPSPSWGNVTFSRRGYGGAGDSIAFLDANFPTRFAHPFRSEGSVNMVPLASLQGTNAIDNGLMREDPTTANQPLFGGTGGAGPTDANRHPAFDVALLNKLSNILTTRSNVYALWITVGFFEVEEVPVREGNPDGYALGEEVGAATGEIERHRAFFVIDRSIPVGFLRGENLDTEKAVLVKRILE